MSAVPVLLLSLVVKDQRQTERHVEVSIGHHSFHMCSEVVHHKVAFSKVTVRSVAVNVPFCCLLWMWICALLVGIMWLHLCQGGPFAPRLPNLPAITAALWSTGSPSAFPSLSTDSRSKETDSGRTTVFLRVRVTWGRERSLSIIQMWPCLEFIEKSLFIQCRLFFWNGIRIIIIYLCKYGFVFWQAKKGINGKFCYAIVVLCVSISALGLCAFVCVRARERIKEIYLYCLVAGT